MEKVKTHIDQKPMKEYFKKHITFGFIAIVLGLLISSTYFIFSIINKNWADILLIATLVLGLSCVALSILFLFKCFKTLKAIEASPYDSIIDFKEECIYGESFKNDNKVSDYRLEYQDIEFFFTTDNYIFLKFRNNTMLPISKNDEVMDFLIKKGLKKKR